MSQDHFDEIACTYSDMRPSNQELLRLVYDRAELKPGMSLWDIGCGPGGDLAWFSSKGLSIMGIDRSAKMVQIACRRLGEYKVLCGDVTDLLKQEDDVNMRIATDAFLFKFSLHLMDDPVNVLRLAWNHVPVGGCIVIVSMLYDQQVKSLPTHGYFPSMDRDVLRSVNDLRATILSVREELDADLRIFNTTLWEEALDDNWIQRVENRYMSTLRNIPEDEWEQGLADLKDNLKVWTSVNDAPLVSVEGSIAILRRR